ncbi:energy-coupling factor ABC transporter permease [Microbacterium sp. NPDC057407]|uniref:energy-coupling factor ABC transporter permease n=1 Tax=Microbacterium sp. NPDC057407 TaxID=3346120 RepID=UPI003672A20A
MHVPDHVLTDGTALGAAVISLGAVGCAVWRSRRDLDRDKLLMTAGVTAFVFAAQMINYPVTPGTSGHLIGAALAVVLLGPWLALLSTSTVLVVQALVFGDGGVTALGVNVLLMAVVPVVASAAVVAASGALRGGRRRVTVASGVAAGLSVPVAAAVFTGLYLLGGAATVSAGGLLVAMTGVHALIGIGEAAITALVVVLVATFAPESLWAGRATATRPAARPAVARGLIGAGLVLTVVALVGSSAPDGLESVGLRFGFGSGVGAGWAPLADYGSVLGVPVTLAGIVGIGLCLAVSAAVLRLSAGSTLSSRRA